MGDNAGKRLLLFRNSLGLNQRNFATSLGVSHGTVASVETGLSQPSRKFMLKLSDTYAVNPTWLLEGRGPMLRDDLHPHLHPNASDKTKPLAGDAKIGAEEYSSIKVYDVDVSAGNGLVPIEERSTDQIAFTRSWLIRNQIAADLAGLVRVRGDSMAPTIPDGAYALVDFRGRTQFDAPGVYVVRYDGQIFVKRLSVSDGATVLTSDNNAYAPIIIPTANETFSPIARVRAIFAQI